MDQTNENNEINEPKKRASSKKEIDETTTEPKEVSDGSSSKTDKVKGVLSKMGVSDKHFAAGLSMFNNAKDNAKTMVKDKAKKKPTKGKLILIVVVAFLLFKMVIAPIFAPKKITYEKVYTVLADKVVEGSLQEYFRVNGDVLANNAMNILPDASGKLVRYTVVVGQEVKKGDIIAYVDPSKPGFVFELSPVRAPLAGTITRLPLELGNTVATSDAIAQMGEVDKLKVETYIPERMLANVKIGTKALVEVIAYPGVVYNAEVEEVAPVLDPTTRTAYVKLFIENIDDKIKAGMFAGLKILTIRHENSIVVPISSLITRSGKKYLAVINRPKNEVMKGVSKSASTPEGTRVSFDFDYDVNIVPVELGGQADGNIIVLSGVKIGDIIITNGQSMLVEGSKVKIISDSDIKAEVTDKTDTKTEEKKPNKLKALISGFKSKTRELTGDNEDSAEENTPILLPPEEVEEETTVESTEEEVAPPVDVAPKPVARPKPVATPKPVARPRPVAPPKPAPAPAVVEETAPAPIEVVAPATTPAPVVNTQTNTQATTTGSDDL